MTRILLSTAFLLMAGVVAAKSSDLVTLDLSRSDFVGQKAEIEKAIATGEDFREIGASDRQQIADGLFEIEALLKGSASLSALDEAGKQRAMSLQGGINEALERAKADSRITCVREHVIGSNRPKRICSTVAAKRRAHERTQEQLGGGRKPVSNPGEQL